MRFAKFSGLNINNELDVATISIDILDENHRRLFTWEGKYAVSPRTSVEDIKQAGWKMLRDDLNGLVDFVGAFASAPLPS